MNKTTIRQLTASTLLWLGAALIVGSTLFVTWREAGLAPKRRAET